MARVSGEPVEVWLRDGKPVRFIWRGRLYTVLAVLAGASGDTPRNTEVWRVEASPGSRIPTAIYELRRAAASGNWLLSRAGD